MVLHTTRRSATRAYTLLEVTLVTALLSIVAAMATPAITTMYAHQRLDAAIDSVRGAWATARAKAVLEGRSYRFAVVVGKGNYRVAPDRDAYWGGEGSNGEDDSEGQGYIREGALPGGVAFAQPGGGGSPAPTSSNTALATGSVSPSEFTRFAVFQSDGTATEDVELVFQFKGTRPMVVHLRALTGAVTVRPQGATN
jgi:prepilin-type N-terminal cleavage/methylation domain-containing protein